MLCYLLGVTQKEKWTLVKKSSNGGKLRCDTLGGQTIEQNETRLSWALQTRVPQVKIVQAERKTLWSKNAFTRYVEAGGATTPGLF